MKKILLFAVGALMAIPMMAQTEEDVTHYIANAGFDEDLTFQKDGSTKEIVSKNTSLSGRSWAYIAADSSVYAKPKDTSSQNRPDGRKMEAVNGFAGRVAGWTLQTGGEFPACEWTYFGTIPYDLENQAIPIADDGSTYLETPLRPEADSGEDNVGFVYMRAGWGGKAIYKQTVDLPCAQYRLEYWAINTNPSATNGKNLSKVTCRRETWTDETGFNDTEWTKHTIEFTPVAEFTMEFGFESSGGSNSNPFLCIDGIKLYKIGEASEEEILNADLNAAIGDINELIDQATALGLTGLVTEMSDRVTEIDGEIGGDVESMAAALRQANADIEKFKEAIAAVEEIDAALAKMDNLLNNTSFAGYDVLAETYEVLLSEKTDGNADTLLGLVERIEAAIIAYYQSQEATEENPADYTYLVKNPWFIQPQYEPSGNAEIGYTYTIENPGDYLTSDGWYRGSYTDGDQRLNYTVGRSCWNAWASGFTQTVSISQDMTGLPNGYYKVSADLITQAGYITNQHTYAKSTVQKMESPVMTVEGWDSEEWETLTSDKVLVVDGKLTIGAEGTGNGNASAGWFCATNFKLWYLGAADENALNEIVNQAVADANAFAATMHFAADKAALLSAIDSVDVTNVETLSILSEAMDVAKASEAKYEEYMMEGKTLPTVEATLDGEGYGAATAIVKFAYEQTMAWINGSEATYTEIDSRVNLLKNYLNTYAPVFNQAAEVAEATTSESAKASIQALMAEQEKVLTSELKDGDTVNELLAALKAAIFDVNKQAIWETEGATDYTAFIMNPNIEAEDGWTIDKGNGNNNSASGQWFDGSATRYFDSYNSGGLIGYIATQLVTGLPNGTYTVGVYTRTPAEGAYVFTAPAEDAEKAFTEIPMNTWIDGEGVEQVASDTHGPIWEEAAAKMNELAEDDPMYSYYYDIYNANNGQGRGFQHQDLIEVVVENHELLIGTATGSEALGTEKVFAGNWYSVGGWTLTLTALGDNEGWPGPLGAADGIKGDVNGDGAVDVADISAIISVMAGTADYSVADVNGDGAVDVADISNVISIMAANARTAKF